LENILQIVGYTRKYFAQNEASAFYWKDIETIIIENILLKIIYIGKYFAFLSLKLS